MATRLKEVDAVMVGMGWTGAILARELTKAGLNVVGLERGADRNPADEFTLTRLRDELRYVVRLELMQDNSIDTITFRNAPDELALPIRRFGAFLPGEGVGGTGIHWGALHWRLHLIVLAATFLLFPLLGLSTDQRLGFTVEHARIQPVVPFRTVEAGHEMVEHRTGLAQGSPAACLGAFFGHRLDNGQQNRHVFGTASGHYPVDRRVPNRRFTLLAGQQGVRAGAHPHSAKCPCDRAAHWPGRFKRL